MKRIADVFGKLNERGHRALIPYITAGDPSIDETAHVLDFLADNGADIIEVGVPFSDPMADGPVIQRAMERALKSGTTVRRVLDLVADFRRHHSTPVVLMGYANPFYAYGFEEFAAAAGEAGVDGVLTVDLPPEESDFFTTCLRKRGIASIFLTTPVTDAARLRVITGFAGGFLYFVSVTGVTGERVELPSGLAEKLLEVKRSISLPLVLGFGISGPDAIERYSPFVDGLVVGSALVSRLEEARGSEEKAAEFQRFFKSLAGACHKTPQKGP